MCKVVINGQEYEYRLDMGAMLYFEELSAKLDESQRTASRLGFVMHYACLLGDERFGMMFDEFVRSIDTQEVLDALTAASAAENKRWSARNPQANETKDGDVKKK